MQFETDKKSPNRYQFINRYYTPKPTTIWDVFSKRTGDYLGCISAINLDEAQSKIRHFLDWRQKGTISLLSTKLKVNT